MSSGRSSTAQLALASAGASMAVLAASYYTYHHSRRRPKHKGDALSVDTELSTIVPDSMLTEDSLQSHEEEGEHHETPQPSQDNHEEYEKLFPELESTVFADDKEGVVAEKEEENKDRAAAIAVGMNAKRLHKTFFSRPRLARFLVNLVLMWLVAAAIHYYTDYYYYELHPEKMAPTPVIIEMSKSDTSQTGAISKALLSAYGMVAYLLCSCKGR